MDGFIPFDKPGTDLKQLPNQGDGYCMSRVFGIQFLQIPVNFLVYSAQGFFAFICNVATGISGCQKSDDVLFNWGEGFKIGFSVGVGIFE